MAHDVEREYAVLASARSEIERLKAVIRTKDACLFNFARTLRAADEQEEVLSRYAGGRHRASGVGLRVHEACPLPQIVSVLSPKSPFALVGRSPPSSSGK